MYAYEYQICFNSGFINNSEIKFKISISNIDHEDIFE